jgi:hypothetical protein
MASVARSGRPSLVTTCLTSSKRRRIASTCVEIATDSGSDTDGSLRVSTRIDPSSSLGMNSVPMNGSDPMAIATATIDTPIVRAR